MIETAQQIEEMKRYLFHEMPEDEREEIEERFFGDDEYFFELVNLENDLVDRYARGTITGDELTRFERSLAESPDRREKIANARALQMLIAEEKSAPVALTAPPSFFEKLSGFFRHRFSGLQLAAGALAAIMICVSGIWLYLNWQKQNEFAEIEQRREAERIEKENRLRQLEEEQRRLEELNKQKQENQPPEITNGTNTETNTNRQTVDDRKNEIDKLRKEVEEMRRKKDAVPSNQKEMNPSKPILAVSFFPTGRGGAGGMATADIDSVNGKQVVKITQPLPEDVNYASVEIVSKEETIESKEIAAGAKSVVFYLPANEKISNIEIKARERTNTRGSAITLGTYELKITKKNQ